jgi:acetyltransferase-like isoleucine patch superfamily enzyme
MTPRLVAKRTAQSVAVLLTSPAAALCGFGRVLQVYTFFAHFYALFPGIVGNLLRGAFYRLTLRQASIDTNISFGTYFVYPEASIGPYVAIGAYCVIGRARIGERTQIASHVEIPGGRHQHERDAMGRLRGSTDGETVIGSRCWIGASAIIMADVGDGSTIGAGSVVVKNIPPHSVAVGNPAKVIRSAVDPAGGANAGA